MAAEIEIKGRGEEFTYRRGDLKLSMDRTYGDGHRLFCDNTSGARGFPSLSLPVRRQVITDLCDYFDARTNPLIFVIDESDKDRGDLERLFEILISAGYQLAIEYDSEEKRNRRKDDMYIGILRAGKELTINGTDIASEAEYWRWKGDA